MKAGGLRAQALPVPGGSGAADREAGRSYPSHMVSGGTPSLAAVRDLERLASLVAEWNRIGSEISDLIGRPALPGHIGEFIAAHLFGIDLESSATAKGLDGRFRAAPRAGASVNIKWYAKREGLLDITPDCLPPFYLVMTGTKTPPASSRGTSRPWTIASVYLFETTALLNTLRARGVRIGVATSVAGELWSGAEVYPRESDSLPLSPEQRRLLALFGPPQSDPGRR